MPSGFHSSKILETCTQSGWRCRSLFGALSLSFGGLGPAPSAARRYLTTRVGLYCEAFNLFAYNTGGKGMPSVFHPSKIRETYTQVGGGAACFWCPFFEFWRAGIRSEHCQRPSSCECGRQCIEMGAIGSHFRASSKRSLQRSTTASGTQQHASNPQCG